MPAVREFASRNRLAPLQILGEHDLSTEEGRIGSLEVPVLGEQRRAPPISIFNPSAVSWTKRILGYEDIQPGALVNIEAVSCLLIGERTYFTADGQVFTDDSFRANFDPVRFVAERRKMHGHTELWSSKDGVDWVDPLVHRVEEIDHPVICLNSAESSNYGSYLFRIIPKLLAVRHLVGTVPVLVMARSEWQRRLLAMFDVPERNIINHKVTVAYKLKRAIIPALRNSNAYIDQETRALFRNKAVALGRGDFPNKIFISRLKADGSLRPTRAFLDESAMIEALKTFGYVPVRPEILNNEDQIRLFANATHIIGPAGSGLFNTVFCKDGTALIDMESEPHWLYAHSSLFSSSMMRYHFAIGQTVAHEERKTHLNWTINIKDFIHYFEKNI